MMAHQFAQILGRMNGASNNLNNYLKEMIKIMERKEGRNSPNQSNLTIHIFFNNLGIGMGLSAN